MRLAVLGAGAWGTALAIHFSRCHRVALWTRERDEAQALLRDRSNERFLPGFPIPDAIGIGTDLPAALEGAELALVVTPTAGLRGVTRGVAAARPGLPVVWACKGFEAGTARLPHEVVAEELPAGTPYGVFTGPSFAREVAEGLPAAVTLASADEAFAVRTAHALHNTRLRVYSSTDVIGAEVGGAVKNVMAIAAGISDGLGFGYNARAALITRGLAEVTRLGLRLGGQLETFMGLAGAGDLILTCTGDLSRNRRVGLALAEGRKLDQVLADLGHTAEGVYTAREVQRLARDHQVDMPITEAVCSILYDDVPAAEAVEALLRREPKAEANF